MIPPGRLTFVHVGQRVAVELIALLDTEGSKGLKIGRVDDIGDDVGPGLQIAADAGIQLVAIPDGVLAEQWRGPLEGCLVSARPAHRSHRIGDVRARAWVPPIRLRPGCMTASRRC